jgi:hypothetical protein
MTVINRQRTELDGIASLDFPSKIRKRQDFDWRIVELPRKQEVKMYAMFTRTHILLLTVKDPKKIIIHLGDIFDNENKKCR